MSRRRKPFNLTNILRWMSLSALLAVFGAIAFLIFWDRLTPQEQMQLMVLSGAALVGGIAAISLLLIYLKRRRAQAWKRAMDAWNRSRQDRTTVNYPSARNFTPAELEKFTA